MAESDWQPVETIPADEQVIVWVVESWASFATVGKAARYPGVTFVSIPDRSSPAPVTHWMPLPDPPT